MDWNRVREATLDDLLAEEIRVEEDLEKAVAERDNALGVSDAAVFMWAYEIAVADAKLAILDQIIREREK